MNGRELFEAIFAGQPVDRLPLLGIWPWGEARERWVAEGLPKDADHNALLGIRGDDTGYLPLNLNMVPTFPIRVLKMDADYVTLVDEFGVTKKTLRSDYDRSGGCKAAAGNMSSMSYWIDFPVKDVRSWKAIHEQRFRPELAGRVPENWEQCRRDLIERSATRWMSFFGFPFFGLFGPMRELMGLEGLAYAMADDPELVHTIADDLVDFWLKTFSQVLPGPGRDGVRLDGLTLFEDMCATRAPLIGPAAFREFMAPGYRRFIGGMREMGVKEFHVDTDGNAWLLIPEFIAASATGTSPCEAQAGMDVVRLREAFPGFNLAGGIGKRALTRGPVEIDAELRRCIACAWRHGRYTPSLDHGAPPDISWENAKHYARRMKEWCTREGAGR